MGSPTTTLHDHCESRQPSPSIFLEVYYSTVSEQLRNEPADSKADSTVGVHDSTDGDANIKEPVLVKVENEWRYLSIRKKYEVFAERVVADPVQEMFMRSMTVLRSGLSAVILGYAADDRYVVGIQNIRDNEPLTLQHRSNLYQWKIGFPEGATSNAYFSLYLTKVGSNVRYYALPSEDGTMILKSSVSSITNVYVFSWTKFTSTKEVRVPSTNFFSVRSTSQRPASPPHEDCIKEPQIATSPFHQDSIKESPAPPSCQDTIKKSPATPPRQGTTKESATSSPHQNPIKEPAASPPQDIIKSFPCIEKNHKVNIIVEEKNRLRYMCLGNCNVVTTTWQISSQSDDLNVLFYWKNLKHTEGHYIILQDSNEMKIGITNMEDDEILMCEDSRYHELKVEYFENKVTSEHFSLSFTSENNKSYYIIPSADGEPMRVHSNPCTDVYVFKLGNIDCVNVGTCVFRSKPYKETKLD